MSRHIKAEIKPGDRHDRILRLLCGGEDWRAKSPSDCCPLWYWYSAGKIVRHLCGDNPHAIGSLALATDISTCRAHLWARWPGWGIANEQRWKDDYKASYYRIAPSARQPSGADAITAYDKLKGAK